MAKLIVLEGPDKVGKETQSKLLQQRLSDRGIKAVRVEPTKESHPKGRKMIYSMLESGAAKRHPNAFQFVQFVNRMYFRLFKLPGFMRSNDVVILDRWSLSGYVYGKCEGINPVLNRLMYWIAKSPDRTLVLQDNSYRRDAADDSYEKDTELQAKVKLEYERACTRMDRVTAIDNRWSVIEVNDDIISTLQRFGIIK